MTNASSGTMDHFRIQDGKPMVALESSVISQGLPHPVNLETSLAMEEIIRKAGAIPATIAIMEGKVTIGCTREQIRLLATAPQVLKASSRDIALAITQKKTAATTVSATLAICRKANISVFSTGGIGGVHPMDGSTFPDISADLLELSKSKVLVICSGAKSILDIQGTLEAMESLGIPVIGYKTDNFPAFYLQRTRHRIPHFEKDQDVVAFCTNHWAWNSSAVVLCNPIKECFAIDPESWSDWLSQAISEAKRNAIFGHQLTPFLLNHVSKASKGQTLKANTELLKSNAEVGARISQLIAHPKPPS